MFRFPGLLAAGVLLLMVAGCGQTRTYDARGIVVGFGDDPRTIIVEHEAIRGLMPAMTMPFKVLDPVELESLVTGDPIRFQIRMTADSSWIFNLAKLEEGSIEGMQRSASWRIDSPLLAIGDMAPDFELLDHNGKALTRSGLEGTAFIVTFIYTRCPIPDYCPLMTRNFQQLQPILAERFGDRVRLVSISFDTEYDTPAVMADYGRRHTRDLETWSFATGSADEVERVAQQFGVYYMTAQGEINHNLTTTLVGPDGRIFRSWRGNQWQPAEVVEATEELFAKAF
jgi:protein SCO1